MNNAEWCIKNNIHFKDLRNVPCFNSQFESIGYYSVGGQYHELYKGEVLENAAGMSILTWLDMEHKDPILDDIERQYLSAVINPFRDRVEYISKKEDFDGPFDGPAEFIHIELSDGNIADFPDFKANTMYKDMKLGYEYSLEELGL